LPTEENLLIIAIVPDKTMARNGSDDSYSARWVVRLKELGHDSRTIDIAKTDVLGQIRGCDAFMWRMPHAPYPRLFAQKLLQAVEHGLNIPVFPDTRTNWHYDDKIAQSYLLEAANIPMPRTWVFWDWDKAVDFSRSAAYPLVMKLARGASSQNVMMVNTPGEAHAWIDRMFHGEVYQLQGVPSSLKSRIRPALHYLYTGLHPDPGFWYESQKHYVLFQEYLPGNAHDTRVTVIGKRAFAFQRQNRVDDFRASGSGKILYEPDMIDLDFVRLAMRVSRELRLQTTAIDGLYQDGKPVIVEISYTYASQAVHDCPGHWILDGLTGHEDPHWAEGHVWPQDLILDSFLEQVTGQPSL